MRTWTDRDEIAFIRGLGYHRHHSSHGPMDEVTLETKRDLLQGYLNGCALRTDWTGLNKNRILTFAAQELRKYVGLLTPRKD